MQNRILDKPTHMEEFAASELQKYDDNFSKFYGPASKPAKDFYMCMERSMEQWNGCASYGLQGVTGLKKNRTAGFYTRGYVRDERNFNSCSQ